MFYSDRDKFVTYDTQRGLELRTGTGAYSHRTFWLTRGEEKVQISTEFTSRCPTEAEQHEIPGLQSVIRWNVLFPTGAILDLTLTETREAISGLLSVYKTNHDDNHRIPVDVTFDEPGFPPGIE